MAEQVLRWFISALAAAENTRYAGGVLPSPRRKTWAYRQDQLSSTHPIVAGIDLADVQGRNFGFALRTRRSASVLRQMVAWDWPELHGCSEGVLR